MRRCLQRGFTSISMVLAFVTAAAAEAPFAYKEAMVPMRDGVRLQTVILAPVKQTKSLPILLQRRPYGVPAKAFDKVPASLKELADDGYIFVLQNLRGRFKSEGVFELSSQADLTNPKSVNETTEAYDTIDWLVKNVPLNNGRIGILGVSYDGLTAAMTLLKPHPALKALSEQASPADQWMNDDNHRFGALRLSYAFEYSVMEQSDKEKNVHFEFSVQDTYQWYLDVGPLSNLNDRYLHDSVPYWNSVISHPDYDDFNKKEASVRQLHDSPVPNLNVACFWDQEDPWGPWQIFRHSAESDPNHNNFMVAGPWSHGQWQEEKAERIGRIDYGGHDTAREFRHDIQAPFFRYYLHGNGERFNWRAKTFQSGSNTWHTYNSWPPTGAIATKLYLHSDGTLSFTEPVEGKLYREYVSDPANPVPYRMRPISPTYPGGDWRTWETDDQRFADHRPDVLTYVSAPLERDLIVTGEVAARVYASTSGTDSDLVIKLIDVYAEDAQVASWNAETGPEPGEYARSLNGTQLPIAMEVRRGRYLKSFEKPEALEPNVPSAWDIPLRDRDHVFRKGHRIMVQVQSTWCPLIDRNPQKFVASIYRAKEEDFVRATQRVYSTPTMPSHIVLPIILGAPR
ncbi:MAG: X-Pro dipeptidyl-peptidase [Bryobacterales bacterium]|jgi:putative CocE/NonD family hydrolase|nr:X-Pro dipeptidyl-peptidase [Bryobacterales bacterium]